MSYDGNGTYNPPQPQYPVVSGNTIYAEDFNTIISDIAAALSIAFTRDGQAPATGDFDLGTHGLKNIATIAAVVAGLVISGTVSFSGGVAFLQSVSVPTKANGTNTTDAASCAFVLQTAMNAALPFQAGNAGKFLTTDGANAIWQTVPAPWGSTLYLNANCGGF